jgi:Spy/CpxP family protein refolding chaperone
MKLNRMITLCAAAAALTLSTGSLLAQDTGNGNGGGGGGQGGGGGYQRRNFDPAQMQQRVMDNIRDELNFTNDTDWSAVQPLVQKVIDARMSVGFPDMRRLMFGGRNRGNGGPGGPGGPGGGGNRRFGGPFGQPSPEQEALQKALDEDAPTAQVKDLLAKYEAAKKDKQAKLEQAQADLRAVLTSKQEAQATLLGLLD